MRGCDRLLQCGDRAHVEARTTGLAGRFALAWGDTAGTRLSATWTGVGAEFAAGIDPRLVQIEDVRRGGMAALAFKVMSDPFVGKLTYFRVYSGQIQSGTMVLNSTRGKRERIGRILQMHANHREEIDQVSAGDGASTAEVLLRMGRELDGFDRRFDTRTIAIVEAPVFEGDAMRVGWEVTYGKSGVAPWVLRPLTCLPPCAGAMT